MKSLETHRLLLRSCEDRDRDLFFEVSSDPRVLEFFPFHRSREDADAVFDHILQVDANEDGLEFYALELKSTGEPIGFSGLSKPKLEPILPEGTVEIGWRLSARHWRNGYATEAASALLDLGFDTLELPEILSFTVHDNHRSSAVMRRLGMRRDPQGDFDHPHIPDSHPQLKRHILYRLARGDWRKRHTL